MENIYDLIIVGGGPVGLYAAFYAGIRKLKVKLIESLPQLGGQAKALYPKKYIYDLPGNPKVLAEDFIENLILQVQQFDIDIHLNQTVHQLEQIDEGKIIQIHTKNEIHYARSLLITIGRGKFIPRKIQLEAVNKIEKKNLLMYFIQDPNRFQNKKVAIFGGGESAISSVLQLLDQADTLYLIHRSDIFRGSEMILEQIAKHIKVKLLLFYTLKDIKLSQDQNKIEEIYLNTLDEKNGKSLSLKVDFILLNLGFDSNMEEIKSWKLKFYEDSSNLEVNRKMNTSNKNIWAAGDIVHYSGKLKLLSVGFSEAVIAINSIKNYLFPKARFFPGHSTHFKKGFFKF